MILILIKMLFSKKKIAQNLNLITYFFQDKVKVEMKMMMKRSYHVHTKILMIY